MRVAAFAEAFVICARQCRCTHSIATAWTVRRKRGGPFAAEIYVPTSSLTINGPLNKHTRVGSSGMRVHRNFCSNCGTVVVTEFEVEPAYVCVKSCRLDDPSWLKPEFHLYVSSRQPWDAISDGLPQYQGDF
jgi:hypothetical protein